MKVEYLVNLDLVTCVLAQLSSKCCKTNTGTHTSSVTHGKSSSLLSLTYPAKEQRQRRKESSEREE